jgi:hypothetical protein
LLLVACIPPRWQLVATSYKLRLDEEKDLFLLRSMDMPSLHRKWWCGDWGPGRKTRIGFSVNTERNGTCLASVVLHLVQIYSILKLSRNLNCMTERERGGG